MSGPTLEQMEALVAFLEGNKEMVLGQINRTKEGREAMKRKWEQCALTLNTVSVDCPSRDANAWRSYFTDLKSKLLKKIRTYKKELSATGGGNHCPLQLTPLQERLYTILGRDVGEQLPGVRINPLEVESEAECVANSDATDVMAPLILESEDWPSTLADRHLVIEMVEEPSVSAAGPSFEDTQAQTHAPCPMTVRSPSPIADPWSGFHSGAGTYTSRTSTPLSMTRRRASEPQAREPASLRRRLSQAQTSRQIEPAGSRAAEAERRLAEADEQRDTATANAIREMATVMKDMTAASERRDLALAAAIRNMSAENASSMRDMSAALREGSAVRASAIREMAGAFDRGINALASAWKEGPGSEAKKRSSELSPQSSSD